MSHFYFRVESASVARIVRYGMLLLNSPFKKDTMGTWGPGNFENDEAAEYLINLCKPILDQITETVARPALMEPDEPDSDIMLANIEILSILAENIGRYEKGWVGDFVFPFPYPPPEKIEHWKLEYLRVWDGYIDCLVPNDEYKRKRREIIISTFDRLKQASAGGPKINNTEQS